MNSAASNASNLHDQATIPPTTSVSGTWQPVPEPRNSSAILGDYELLEELGRGGMGVVYKARQRSLNRLVALKMILSGRLASAEDVARFRAEAQAAAALDHPGIVPIYEVDRDQGQDYFTMAFVAGQSLSAMVRDTPLPPRRAAEIVQKLSCAVDHAHRHGIVHRDLKPGNVLMDDLGQPRITDFGLAKRLSPDQSDSGQGEPCGTAGYMPPEQIDSTCGPTGPAGDVYSLGATLYCLLTGRPPFQSAERLETLLQVVRDAPVSPRRLNPAVPIDLETICLKCLEKTPSRRYATATALADDLDRFLTDKAILARPPTLWEQARRWSRQHPGLALSMSISAASIVAALLVSVWFNVLLRGEKLHAQSLSLEAFRLQRMTQQLLDDVSRLKETDRALDSLRFTEYGQLLSDLQRFRRTSDAAEQSTLRSRLTEMLRRLGEEQPESAATIAAIVTALNSPIPTSDETWNNHLAGLTKELRHGWMDATSAIPELREQVRKLVEARLKGQILEGDRVGFESVSGTNPRDLQTLIEGELEIVGSPRMRELAQEFLRLLTSPEKVPRSRMRAATRAILDADPSGETASRSVTPLTENL